MDTQESPRIRPPWLAALMPLALTVGQVLVGSAPKIMIGVGLGLSLAVLVLWWAGSRWLQRARPHLGQTEPLRLWQAPVLWVPLVGAVVVILLHRLGG